MFNSPLVGAMMCRQMVGYLNYLTNSCKMNPTVYQVLAKEKFIGMDSHWVEEFDEKFLDYIDSNWVGDFDEKIYF